MNNDDKIISLQEAVGNDPSDFQSRRELAVLLLDEGYPEESLPHFLYLKNIFAEDSDIYYNLGIVYEKLKNLKKAKESYENAIKFSPEKIDANYNLGLVLTDLGLYEGAVDNFEKVLKVDDTDSNAYFCIGLAYFKMEKYDEAQYNFKHTIELDNTDIYAHFYLGNVYNIKEDKENAILEFKKVIEISPDYSWAYYNLAKIYWDNGNIDVCIENLNMTLELNPKDLEAYKVYSQILFKLNDVEGSKNIVEKGLEKCGENGDLYYFLAQINKNCGDKSEYIRCMGQSLKHFQSLSVSASLVKKELDKNKNK